MSKFSNILKTSLSQEFIYKLNFIMWRVRNVIQILVFFFLWKSVFATSEGEVFGYTEAKIFTYAFALIVVRALVFSARSVDVAGIIANGDLTNILLKPVNFFKYWISRDLGSKILNLCFGTVEVSLLVFILKPNIFWQSNIFYLFIFIISLLIASFLFFTFLMSVNFAPFWMPEISWGAQFLFMSICAEFLSGAFFPLDVFPSAVFNVLSFTPFPYLIYFPIKMYLGSFSVSQSFGYLGIGLVWCLISWNMMKSIWRKGLLIYEAYGR